MRKLIVFASVTLSVCIIKPSVFTVRRSMQQDHDKLVHINAQLENDIHKLEADVASLNGSRNYQEHVIRDELGWARPGEITIILDDE